MNEEPVVTSKAWLASIMVDLFRSVHNQEQDNFDSFRYPEAHRNAFFYDAHARFLGYLNEHLDSFHASRALLEDQPSRDLFDKLILYRLLGHLHVRLPFNNPETIQRMQVPDEWKIDDTGDMGMFGPLSIFSVPHKGSNIWMKGWTSNVAAAFLSEQYYFDRAGIRIAPALDDHVIDGGGCFGDTALAFANEVGPSGMIYTFDPIPKHCEIMREAFQMNPRLASHIKIFDVGLAKENHAGKAAQVDERSINPGARLDDGLPTRTIDDLVGAQELDRIDFIKMDIEGSELGALQGGEKSLRRWRPKLAISLYHRPEDFFAIPLWLDSLDCGYRYYLDHYSIHNEETVLYAISSASYKSP
ncbi:MAG: FkbM family methyltransferase [Betaproteobacteria bacterium]